MVVKRLPLPMRHAFIVTAYRDLGSLKSLFEQLLDLPNSRVYCHIDARSKQLAKDAQHYLEKMRREDAHFERIYLQANQTIRWASSDHFQVQMQLCGLAAQDGADYFHTMTGQCRLICTAERFTQFFEEHASKSFMELAKMPAAHWSGNGGLDRVAYYQLYDLLDARRYGRVFDVLNRALLKVQRTLSISRLDSYPSVGNTFWGGLGYWSLHQSAMQHLLAHPSLQERSYRHSLCAEEFVPQSILMNNPHFQAHPEQLINHTLRYVHWESSHGEVPGILDATHLPVLTHAQLQTYPALFARKFDSMISKTLIAQLPISN
jgi:hypothetical protein